MPWTPSRFVWRELLTPDVPRARGFYGELFGWTFEELPMGQGAYTMIRAGERTIGGMMPLAPGADLRPHWMSYVSVDDVDARCAAAIAHGGRVCMEPFDLPETGRMAIVADPHGARLTLFRSLHGDPPPQRPQPGWFCWETLRTPNLAQAHAFYAEVVGWGFREAPSGDPKAPICVNAENSPTADTLHSDEAPRWVTYVFVQDIEHTNVEAERLGATIVEGRIDIPKVGAIAFLEDPSGALLGTFTR